MFKIHLPDFPRVKGESRWKTMTEPTASAGSESSGRWIVWLQRGSANWEPRSDYAIDSMLEPLDFPQESGTSLSRTEKWCAHLGRFLMNSPWFLHQSSDPCCALCIELAFLHFLLKRWEVNFLGSSRRILANSQALQEHLFCGQLSLW